ncbi:MAG: L,D-transpeptidase [Smithellaceae bacterium]
MVTRVSACILSALAVIIVFFLLSPSDSPSSVASPNEKIPDAIISITSGYVIVVDKKEQKLFVFKKNSAFSRVFEAPCSTGKNSGGKQVEGDAKTPVGIFFVTRIARNPGPPETYGSLALPLDYPNLSDMNAGRQGTNIWIHGTTNALIPFQSNGCVVLRDSDILKLEQFVHLNKTPVIITESIHWITQNETQAYQDELTGMLKAWRNAVMEGNLEALDALYLAGTEIKNKKRSDLIKRIGQMKNTAKHFILEPRDVSILKHEDSAVIVFDQITSIQPDNTFQGMYNRLTLQKKNNRWYVIDESTPLQLAKKPTPIIANAQPAVTETQDFSADREKIRQLINRWSISWESGDMNAYRGFYASNFRSRGMNLNAWIDNKTDIRNRSKKIRIRLERIRIVAGPNTAEATFTQNYSSSILKSKGDKKLSLRKINGEWKIYRESMQ